jgi:hypothetical protein
METIRKKADMVVHMVQNENLGIKEAIKFQFLIGSLKTKQRLFIGIKESPHQRANPYKNQH